MRSVSSSPALKALIFDLDGTLLDSFGLHYRAYIETFRAYGIEVTPEQFWQVYSPDWLEVYRAYGLSEETWEAADEIWLSVVAREQPALFPGVPALLQRLGALYPMAIVTSGSGERVRRDLQGARLSDLFEVVITGDDVVEPKPAPEGLLQVCDRLQLSPSNALYIGDTATDFAAAQAAGMPFVGVRSPLLRTDDRHPFPLLPSISDLFGYLAL